MKSDKEIITNNEVMGIKTVAEYFGVSIRTIREWMKKDDDFPKPFNKFRTLRFRASEVQKYWTENTKDPTENDKEKKGSDKGKIWGVKKILLKKVTSQ
jgi:predicted DNA-binding transcriptional regulator AlpA